MIAKRDLALAEEIHDLERQLRGDFLAEALRVLTLGIPLSNMIRYGMVDKINEGGRESLIDTRDSLVVLVNYQKQGRSVREAWSAHDKGEAQR